MHPYDQSTRSALRALKELYDEGLISDRTWQNQQEEILAAASNRASGAAAAAALGNEQAAPVGAQPQPQTPTSNANATTAGTSTGLQRQAARDFDPEATPSLQPSSPQRQHQRRKKRPPQRFTHEEELARPQCMPSHARSPPAAPDAPSVKEGVLVWANVQGHPWWPASVAAADTPRPSGELTVLFMGTGDKATIKRKENVVLLDAVDRKDMEARARNHPRMGGEVQRSFEVALRCLAKMEQWRSDPR